MSFLKLIRKDMMNSEVFFDFDNLNVDKKKLEEETLVETFWNNSKKAQYTLKKNN